MPRRPTHSFVEQQSGHAAMRHSRPALIAIRDHELRDRTFGRGLEMKTKTFFVERAASETMTVEQNLHLVRCVLHRVSTPTRRRLWRRRPPHFVGRREHRPPHFVGRREHPDPLRGEGYSPPCTTTGPCHISRNSTSMSCRFEPTHSALASAAFLPASSSMNTETEVRWLSSGLMT